jgi:hypothetical protein
MRADVGEVAESDRCSDVPRRRWRSMASSGSEGTYNIGGSRGSEGHEELVGNAVGATLTG